MNDVGIRVSKKPAARFRPGLAQARSEPVYGRASPFMGGPARRPAPLKKTTKIKSIKKNILYFYIYIINSFNKHKRNVVQLVRALKFNLEGRGSNPPLSLPLFKSYFGLFKKPVGLARGLIGRAAGLAFLHGPARIGLLTSQRAYRPGPSWAAGLLFTARPGPPCPLETLKYIPVSLMLTIIKENKI